MKKEEMHLRSVHGFELGHITSGTAADINRAWMCEVPICEQTARRWFLKFRSGDISLEDQGCRRRPSAFDSQQLKTLVEKTHVKVSEKCLR